MAFKPRPTDLLTDQERSDLEFCLRQFGYTRPLPLILTQRGAERVLKEAARVFNEADAERCRQLNNQRDKMSDEEIQQEARDWLGL